MIIVKWDIEEAAVLIDFYLKHQGLSHSKEELSILTRLFRKRAVAKGIAIDEKFRNRSGLSMQLGCIHYVAMDGKGGGSNASKLFYDTYALSQTDTERFNSIVRQFYLQYS